MNISKLDAAKRQLEAAVRLFFVNGDPIATHTLTGAARSLFIDLIRHEGKEVGILAMFESIIKPEYLKEVRSKLVEAQNFFKHADKDPDELFDFNPAVTELLILDACLLYEELVSHKDPLLTVYRVWFNMTKPQLFAPEAQEGIQKAAEAFNPQDRPGFLNALLPVAEQRLSGGLKM